MIIIWLIYRIIIDPSMDTDLSKMLTVETDQIQLPMLVTCILTLYNHYIFILIIVYLKNPALLLNSALINSSSLLIISYN